MKLQHKARQKEAKQEFVPAKPEKQFGFVAVAAGNGIESMFIVLDNYNAVTYGFKISSQL